MATVDILTSVYSSHAVYLERVAAKNLNRDFIGIELDETYFNIAEARINGNS